MPAPPFTLTPLILSQLAEICEQVGQLEGADGVDWGSRSPQLRKDKRIRSIHSSLAIENNCLSLDQVTAVIEGKRVLGLQREVREVKNDLEASPCLPTDHVSDQVTVQVKKLLRTLCPLAAC